MRKLCVFLIGCACFASTHGATFYADTDQTEVTLGQSFTLTLHAENVATSLKQLQVDILKKDFAVAGVDIQDQAKSQVMRLRLYPLQPGLITIPPLYFGGLRSKALNVLIQESSANIPRVVIKTGFSSNAFVERQATYFYVDVYHDGSLQWRAPEAPVTPDAHIRALPPLLAVTDASGAVVQRYPYTLMPLKSGAIQISWPLVEASKFGELLRYAIPASVIEATAIPRYLPLHVPVGKVTIAAHPPTSPVKINQPFNWVLIIQGTGLSAESLAKLLDFSENETLKIYPAQVEMQTSGNALLQTAKFTVPIVPLKSGRVHLPRVVLPYYDPPLGRIEAAVVPESVVRVFNPLLQWAWWVGIALIICFAMGFVLWKAVHYFRRLFLQRAWLKRLVLSQDVRGLRNALLAPNYKGTLRQWLAMYQLRFGDNPALQEQIERLDRFSFSNAAPKDFSRLQQAILVTLRNRQNNKAPTKPAPLNLFELVRPPRSCN